MSPADSPETARDKRRPSYKPLFLAPGVPEPTPAVSDTKHRAPADPFRLPPPYGRGQGSAA